jgi:hypothetical protein
MAHPPVDPLGYELLAEPEELGEPDNSKQSRCM